MDDSRGPPAQETVDPPSISGKLTPSGYIVNQTQGVDSTLKQTNFNYSPPSVPIRHEESPQRSPRAPLSPHRPEIPFQDHLNSPKLVQSLTPRLVSDPYRAPSDLITTSEDRSPSKEKHFQSRDDREAERSLSQTTSQQHFQSNLPLSSVMNQDHQTLSRELNSKLEQESMLPDRNLREQHDTYSTGPFDYPKFESNSPEGYPNEYQSNQSLAAYHSSQDNVEGGYSPTHLSSFQEDDLDGYGTPDEREAIFSRTSELNETLHRLESALGGLQQMSVDEQLLRRFERLERNIFAALVVTNMTGTATLKSNLQPRSDLLRAIEVLSNYVHNDLPTKTTFRTSLGDGLTATRDSVVQLVGNGQTQVISHLQQIITQQVESRLSQQEFLTLNAQLKTFIQAEIQKISGNSSGPNSSSPDEIERTIQAAIDKLVQNILPGLIQTKLESAVNTILAAVNQKLEETRPDYQQIERIIADKIGVTKSDLDSLNSSINTLNRQLTSTISGLLPQMSSTDEQVKELKEEIKKLSSNQAAFLRYVNRSPVRTRENVGERTNRGNRRNREPRQSNQVMFHSPNQRHQVETSRSKNSSQRIPNRSSSNSVTKISTRDPPKDVSADPTHIRLKTGTHPRRTSGVTKRSPMEQFNSNGVQSAKLIIRPPLLSPTGGVSQKPIVTIEDIISPNKQESINQETPGVVKVPTDPSIIPSKRPIIRPQSPGFKENSQIAAPTSGTVNYQVEDRDLSRREHPEESVANMSREVPLQATPNPKDSQTRRTPLSFSRPDSSPDVADDIITRALTEEL